MHTTPGIQQLRLAPTSKCNTWNCTWNFTRPPLPLGGGDPLTADLVAADSWLVRCQAACRLSSCSASPADGLPAPTRAEGRAAQQAAAYRALPGSCHVNQHKAGHGHWQGMEKKMEKQDVARHGGGSDCWQVAGIQRVALSRRLGAGVRGVLLATSRCDQRQKEQYMG
jgi:hypothetical protein